MSLSKAHCYRRRFSICSLVIASDLVCLNLPRTRKFRWATGICFLSFTEILLRLISGNFYPRHSLGVKTLILMSRWKEKTVFKSVEFLSTLSLHKRGLDSSLASPCSPWYSFVSRFLYWFAAEQMEHSEVDPNQLLLVALPLTKRLIFPASFRDWSRKING